MLLLLLLLSSANEGQTQRVLGSKMDNNSCSCRVNSSTWMFPVVRFESVLQKLEVCEGSLKTLQEQVVLSNQLLPKFHGQISSMKTRLEPHQYLHDRGLYTDLSLRLLGQELHQLETEITAAHIHLNSSQSEHLTEEVNKLRKDVEKMQRSDMINMKTVKEKLRYMKNNVESCKTIPKDFRGQHRYCMKGLITNISEPSITKISPYGKSYISGSWGKQAKLNGEEKKETYWIQPLVNSHIYGNILRVYESYKDLMSTGSYKDYSVASSYTHADAVEGPSGVLYGDALYYHCYRSADVCRYDLKTNAVKRVTLPGTGVGINNKFPYCYYDCRQNSDIDIEADETGLWAIYATVGNHGNLVITKLLWDNSTQTINVSQTWETKLFKKAVTNAFMVCGLMYATRYVDEYQEEVFYAFDTSTGREDNSLALPLEKVSQGVASLSYNPTDRHVYMYNDGYLLAYQAYF